MTLTKEKLCGNCGEAGHKYVDCPIIDLQFPPTKKAYNQLEEKAEKWDDWNSKTNSAILFDKYEKMVKRLMESGYVLSKFEKDKTYSQTEMMYIFQGIIEGEK